MDLYYHTCSPPCWSVRLLGHQLGLQFNLVEIDFDAGEHLKEDFLKLNPEHAVPTMVEGDFVLSESRAILSYLVDAHAKGDSPLYPKDAKVRALIQHRLNFDLGTLYQRFFAYCSPMWETKSVGTEADRKKLCEALGFLETYLDRSRYAAGDQMTIADVSLTASVAAIEFCYFNMDKYPKVLAWYETCKKDLVGYQDVIECDAKEFRKFVGEPPEQ